MLTLNSLILLATFSLAVASPGLVFDARPNSAARAKRGSNESSSETSESASRDQHHEKSQV
jgi:hypothetical protein